MTRPPLGAVLIGVFAAAGCSSPPPPSPVVLSPLDASAGPTFGDIFDVYFAPGTPGHCATSGCHADPGHNVWLCEGKDACYAAMIEVGLIDRAEPARSTIGDPARSPLSWINTRGGNMPLDAQNADEGGRDAIQAWVAAGARNE